MPYIFFEDVIREIGLRLNYEAVVNYAGNSFFQKSAELIEHHNPFHIKDQQGKGTGMLDGFMKLFNSSKNVRSSRIPKKQE